MARPNEVRSIIRVALAVAAILLLAAAAIRQPALFSISYPEAAPHADPRALERHIRFLTTNQRRGAAEYIANEFRAAGAEVSRQKFVARGKPSVNVVATFGHHEHEPVLVIGAHYDAFNDLPAADDNASGVAGLLEIARLLGSRELTRPVVLVAYDNEEPPYFASEQMGSFVHAASLENRPVLGMVSLEMIGMYTHDQDWNSWVLSLLYPNRGDFIAVTGGWNDRALTLTLKRAICGTGGIKALSFTGPHDMLDASDQRNYWARGWPAIMITDTAYLRNKNYHTRRDTAETLDYARMAAVADGVFNGIVHLAAK